MRFLGVLFVLIVLSACQNRKTIEKEIVLHCAAAFRNPMQQIVENYKEETGRSIRLNFGASGSLESQLEVAGGDVFFPADESYIVSACEKGLITEVQPLLKMEAGIAVFKKSPNKIKKLDDLKREGVRLSFASFSAAVGKHMQWVLKESGDWQDIQKNIIVEKPTVNSVAADVSLGVVDAGILWRGVALQYEGIDFVPVPLFENHSAIASIAILKRSKKQQEAHSFLKYLQIKGSAVFEKYGFNIDVY